MGEGTTPLPATRRMSVIAQDPSVQRADGRILMASIDVPAEDLLPGPIGYRVQVVDYDSSTGRYRGAHQLPPSATQEPKAWAEGRPQIVEDFRFHAQNVYALVMKTLARFEFALGRRVGWSFKVHQLKVAPSGLMDANAFYSRADEGLVFGYFPGRDGKPVFTCLSHDIVAHETAHALLDGLRTFFLRPSHVDQAAFHEGFADVVALMSILRSAELVELCLVDISDRARLIKSRDLDFDSLKDRVFFKLAKQFGRELSFVRGDALRHSVTLEPSPQLLEQSEFQEPHRRGEILVAAIARTFLKVWCKRLEPRGTDRRLPLNRAVVAEEAATAASQLLHIAIRALDYLPPVDLTFGDYLSALLTADLQLYPDDSKYGYRRSLRDTFEEFGIKPANARRPDGAWDPPPDADRLDYQGLHFEQLQRDPNTLFRFLWENRDRLGIDPDAFTRVTSIRPCVRVSTDGLILRETVVEYVQTLRVFARELAALGIKCPKGLSGQTFLPLYGGGALLFDEFGRVKFHIGTGVRSKRQSARLQSLYDRGAFNRDAGEQTPFADLHRRRMLGGAGRPQEQW